MRKILFRGKRLVYGDWIEGSLWVHLGVPKILTAANTVGYDVYPDTVGQYTGLQDKNGERIFEGDIVADGNDIYVCFWDECNVEFGVKNKDLSFGIAYLPITEYEVIGNIHDDPELMEVTHED